jgi:hypothetical protein
MELDRLLKEKREEILRIAVRHGARNLPAARAVEVSGKPNSRASLWPPQRIVPPATKGTFLKSFDAGLGETLTSTSR